MKICKFSQLKKKRKKKKKEEKIYIVPKTLHQVNCVCMYTLAKSERETEKDAAAFIGKLYVFKLQIKN